MRTLFSEARAAFCIVTLLVGVCLAAVGHGQEVDEGAEIDVQKPPARLVNTALIELLKLRKLRKLPGTVKGVVDQMIYADAPPARAFVPRGRSAQAGSTDEKQAREVFTPHSANKVGNRYPIGYEDYSAFPGSDWEGRIYFGFAPKTGRGEALSWNRVRRKFDYFILSGMDRRGGARVFEVTKREDCNKCHQNEAPIWSVPPWTEIISHDPSERRTGTPIARFLADPIVFLKGAIPITRETTPVENNMAFAYDMSSSIGNRLVQATRAINNVCGEDLRCRRWIMVAAMSNLSQSVYLRKVVTRVGNTGNDLNDLDFIQGPLAPLTNLLNRATTNLNQLPRVLDPFIEVLKNKWPSDGYAFTSHILPDTSTVRTGNATQRQADPLTPRGPLGPIPQNLAVPYLYDVTFETLGLTLEDGVRLAAISTPNRLKALALVDDEVPTKVKKFLETWPPSREQVLAFYGIDLAAEAPPERAERDGDGAADKADKIEERALAHFKKHCLECHNKKEGGAAPFIPFEDIKSLRAYNKDNEQVIEGRLTARNMPPRRVLVKPTEREYQVMNAFFTGENAAELAQNRGQVRTNYLGVRYQDVDGQKWSYVAHSSIAITREGYTEDCGQSIEADASQPQALKAGLGSDGKVYIALENFPTYFIGNIVSLSATPSQSFDRCLVLGVSRNGSLLSLAYNKKRAAFGTVVTRPEDRVTAIALSHVSAVSDSVLATGRDGRIYQVTYPGSAIDRLVLNLVSVQGVTEGRWLKVGIKGTGKDRQVVASSAEGRRSLLVPNGDRTLQLSSGSDDVTEKELPANLLDRTSLVLNPGAPNEK